MKYAISYKFSTATSNGAGRMFYTTSTPIDTEAELLRTEAYIREREPDFTLVFITNIIPLKG